MTLIKVSVIHYQCRDCLSSLLFFKTCFISPLLKDLRAENSPSQMMCKFCPRVVFYTIKDTAQFAHFPALLENKLVVLHLLGAE